MRACPKCGKKYENNIGYCQKDGTQLPLADSTGNINFMKTDSALGQVLGSYRLIDLLGEGGMGRVYLAEHTRLGRKVALKLLKREYSSNPSTVKRFFGEARAVNQINHDNIIEITDFVENEGEEKFLIMELLKGNNLSELQELGILPLSRVLNIILQVCNALSAVHGAGIVHRDLKPENIFLIERSGQKDFVKLMDFGVAKLTDTTEGKSLAATAAGAILGTPEYMSPEQLGGKDVNYRTDIYAIGIILYELVTGQKTFAAKSYGELVIKHLTVAPPKPSKLQNLSYNIPQELEDLILECLEKDPDKRPENISKIESRIKKISEVYGSVEVGSFERTVIPASRRMGLIIGATISCVVIAIIGTLIAFNEDEESPRAEPSQNTYAESLDTDAENSSTKIKIEFDSTPQGAKVFNTEKNEWLGNTPFSKQFGRSEKQSVFSFQLDGYDTITQNTDLLESTDLKVMLKKSITAVSRKRRKKPTIVKKRRGKPRQRGTLDPF